MEFLPSHEIKRQILESANKSEIRARMDKNPPGISEGEQIEIGNELERMTQTGGWTIIEQYMISRMDLVGLATKDGSDLNRGVAKAFIDLMQWIHLTIRRKDQILEKERIRETKNVSDNEEE